MTDPSSMNTADETASAEPVPYSWRKFYGHAFRILSLASVIAVALAWSCVHLGNQGRSERQRGRLSYTKTVMREASVTLDAWRLEHDHYPPTLDNKHHYGVLNEFVPKAYPVVGSPTYSEDDQQLVLIDPNRQTQIFPNERMSTARYNSSRNPDGWVTYEGYPLRYFRPAHGRWALIISNGPDLDEDWDMRFLSTLASTQDDEIVKTISLMSYDPTNGSTSDGDFSRLLGP